MLTEAEAVDQQENAQLGAGRGDDELPTELRRRQDRIATGRLKRGDRPPPVRGRPPNDLAAKGRMRRKLLTRKGRATQSRRKAVVEPVFGQMTTAQDFDRFVLRGLPGARIEWALACAGHNLLKIFRSGTPLSDAPPPDDVGRDGRRPLCPTSS